MEQKKGNTRTVIVADSALRTYLETTFVVSKAFICQALNGKRNSERAKRICEAALKNGAYREERRKVDTPSRAIKVMDSKGNVTRVINE